MISRRARSAGRVPAVVTGDVLAGPEPVALVPGAEGGHRDPQPTCDRARAQRLIDHPTAPPCHPPTIRAAPWPGRLRPTVDSAGRSSRFTTPPSQGAYDAGVERRARPPARSGSAHRSSATSSGSGSSGASGQELASQYVVVLELDPTGRRVLGVVDVDADLGQLDRARAQLLAQPSVGRLGERLARLRGGRSRSWPSAAGTGS